VIGIDNRETIVSSVFGAITTERGTSLKLRTRKLLRIVQRQRQVLYVVRIVRPLARVWVVSCVHIVVRKLAGEECCEPEQASVRACGLASARAQMLTRRFIPSCKPHQAVPVPYGGGWQSGPSQQLARDTSSCKGGQIFVRVASAQPGPVLRVW